MHRPALTAAALTLAATAAHAEPTLRLFGNPDGPLIGFPTALSGDGRVAGGMYYDSLGYTTGGVWTPRDGSIPLPGALLDPMSGSQSFVTALSTCGGVRLVMNISPEGQTSIAWYEDGTTIELGDLGGLVPNGLPFTHAAAVTPSGSHAAGWSLSPGGYLESFLWSRDEGMLGLGDLRPQPSEQASSYALWINEHGTRIRGAAAIDETRSELFEWTPDAGMVPLTNSDAFGQITLVTHAADDGTAMVGLCLPNGSVSEQAFLWTESRGLELLSAQPGASSLIPHKVASDGGVVLFENELWIRGSGWYALDTLADLAGHSFPMLSLNAMAISTDGNTITGRAVVHLQDGLAQLGFLYTFDNPCPADLNGDGVADFFDLAVFLRAFNDGDLFADQNLDGTIDFFDIQSYLSTLTEGCP